MKSFQQAAPTIHSWLQFKRFRQIRRGWLRLLIVVYGVALLGIFIASVNCPLTYQDALEGVAGAVFWLYWPVIRLWLWIYDGFQKDKKISAMKTDSSLNNRNN
jgi:heme A synthase